MLQHHDRFKPSNRKAASQSQVTQQGRSFPVWGVILILALTTLACGLSATGSGSRVQRVVILNRLPTLTLTPRDASMSGQAAAAPAPSVANQPIPPTATATPSIEVPVSGQGAAVPDTAAASQPLPPPVTAIPSIEVPVSGQVVDATDSSIVNPPLPPTATVMPAVEVSGSSQVVNATDTPIASPTLPPTATVTDIPAVEVPATATEVVEPTSTPTDIPTATPQPPANDWSFSNVQLYPDQYEEGLLLLGEMNNNSDAPQTLTEVTGIFYDAQGQVIADTGNTIGYWPVDIIPPGGRVPFELIVEGIQSAANFNLSVEAEPSSIIPRQDFEFLGLNQWNEDDTYCLTGQFHNPGDELQNYLVIGATLYDEQDNIVNFGDYFEPDLEAMGGDQPLEFEICIAPPNQGANRYELWAWGE